MEVAVVSKISATVTRVPNATVNFTEDPASRVRPENAHDASAAAFGDRVRYRI